MFEQILHMSPWSMALAVVDIALVSYVLYRFFVLIRGTRAVQLIKGIIVLLVANALAGIFNLYTINWMLERVILLGAVALPVVFQPELRRALEHLGRGRIFTKQMALGEVEIRHVIDSVVRAAAALARSRTGALIVIERETGLKELIDSGVKVDGLVSAEFLINLFVPQTPLHDGAAIIAGNRVAAAACFLPLAEAADLAPNLGSRHRAAVGVSEHSDALAVVVSEETGLISVAHAGMLQRRLDEAGLRAFLSEHLLPKAHNGFSLKNWGRP